MGDALDRLASDAAICRIVYNHYATAWMFVYL